MHSSSPLSTLATTTMSYADDGNGSLPDDWESYKAYTRFYYLTDEIFLYANPILIIIGKRSAMRERIEALDDDASSAQAFQRTRSR